MKPHLFLFLYFLIPINVFSDQIPTVREYKENIKNNKYDQFILGLENGIDWTSQEAYRQEGILIFCKPSDISLPIIEIKRLINEQLKRDSSFYAKYENEPLIGLALKNAFVRNFPCSGNQRSN